MLKEAVSLDEWNICFLFGNFFTMMSCCDGLFFKRAINQKNQLAAILGTQTINSLILHY